MLGMVSRCCGLEEILLKDKRLWAATRVLKLMGVGAGKPKATRCSGISSPCPRHAFDFLILQHNSYKKLCTMVVYGS